MKLKTATLLACIGTGITVLLQLYSFIKLNLIERSEYNSLEYDLHSILYLVSSIFLFIFFIVFYQKQSNKSWKD